jgi:predicted acyl esterase
MKAASWVTVYENASPTVAFTSNKRSGAAPLAVDFTGSQVGPIKVDSWYWDFGDGTNATDVIVEGGYIRVVQDVRGKHGSEGDYVMNRPLRGPQNPTPVDHATDTYDAEGQVTSKQDFSLPRA